MWLRELDLDLGGKFEFHVGFAPALSSGPLGVCSCPSVSKEVSPWEATCCPGSHGLEASAVLHPPGLFRAPLAFSEL